MTNQELKNKSKSKLIAGILTVVIHLSLALCLIVGPQEIAKKVKNTFTGQDSEQTSQEKKANNDFATIPQNKP